ncbi:acetyl-CoA carboxylase biotin carboxylase subunit [Actinomadura formosensis]|uniref:acetyl-CoA carboxylase biotin carboxylase subunit n=1 Tax=Actinomadura formosensis TaxID=60706 RepID=UPI000830C6C0|nr:biotin carboxylase N-terminal domain-containing protein [Actinomadura formosensis]
MFDRLLIANRGEIAVRVIRTAKRLGIRTVAVFSDADAAARHVEEADEAVRIGPPPVARSYLDMDAVLAAASACGADAVHPGYGFLSENAEFARRVQAAGMTWVGPDPDHIARMGDKIEARNLMASHGVPVSRGTPRPPGDAAAAQAEAARIGYPLMVKAASGGGGIGMTIIRDAADLGPAFQAARTRAERMFGSPDVLLEQYIEPARHIEVQILGLGDGRVLTLGERDCSIQRRFQKVIEETPAPGISAELRRRMLDVSRRAGEALGYRGAGTLEYLVDPRTEEFVFLEMNTRLQVEHPVTELVTGMDLVEAQLLVAAREDAGLTEPSRRDHAIELRIYAEDPVRMFPSPGRIEQWKEPAGEHIRVDTGYRTGDEVTPHYDPLLAKLCTAAATREAAIESARRAVDDFTVTGIKTNLPLLRRVLDSEAFRSGTFDTKTLETARPR